MCGICGYIDPSVSDSSTATIAGMLESIAHRGPDASSFWQSPNSRAALANSRLAIIALEDGNQPFLSECKNYVLVFNGEIYNYREIAAQLRTEGISPKTASDTEILLLSLIQWKEEALHRLRGMFAFAFYDTRRDLLLLARDRMGIKPLYYRLEGRALYFASELKSILSAGISTNKINYPALQDTLCLGYPLLPMTAFRDILEVEPGCLIYRDRTGTISKKRYFSWQNLVSRGQGVSSNRALSSLIDAVGEQLVSDVELGSFLSAGIDSSLIASIVRQEINQELKTFTVSFAESSYDESEQAALIAKQLDTIHQEISLKNNTYDLDYIEKIIAHFDQPFSDSSAIPTYEISKHIRRHVKVALSGDGGDEMFGGYPFFHWLDLCKQIGSLPIERLAPLFLASLSPMPNIQRKARRLLRAAFSKGSDRAVEMLCYIPPSELPIVTSGEFLKATSGYRSQYSSLSKLENPGGLELIDAIVTQMLPGDYLRKVDMMSSAHGLEVRLPYLHEPILSLGASLKKSQLYKGSENKRMLRQIASKYLPKEITQKPKTGFGIPLDTFLGAQARREVANQLLSPGARIHDFISREYSTEIAKSFREMNWNKAKYSRFMLYQRFYTLWSLELWLRKWNPQ